MSTTLVQTYMSLILWTLGSGAPLLRQTCGSSESRRHQGCSALLNCPISEIPLLIRESNGLSKTIDKWGFTRIMMLVFASERERSSLLLLLLLLWDVRRGTPTKRGWNRTRGAWSKTSRTLMSGVTSHLTRAKGNVRWRGFAVIKAPGLCDGLLFSTIHGRVDACSAAVHVLWVKHKNTAKQRT